jgi:hypothetical protein
MTNPCGSPPQRNLQKEKRMKVGKMEEEEEEEEEKKRRRKGIEDMWGMV